MNEILNGYTQEEIEELAIKQLEVEDENLTLKIEKIDKDYKKFNKKAVMKAILNGSIILAFSGIVLSSDSKISEFGTEDLTNIFNRLTEVVSYLPKSDILISLYAKMFDGINFMIDKMGLMGLVLATKSIKFVLSTIKDTKKSLEMRRELLELEAKLNNKEKTFTI